jgi:GTP cyclohydrolase II
LVLGATLVYSWFLAAHEICDQSRRRFMVSGQDDAARIRTRVRVPLRFGTDVLDVATMVTFDGLCDGREHLAVLFGDPLAQPEPLVRLHSECLTGDVFGSARCDCGPQLAEAIRLMCERGGIVLYLRHEGRGIGLFNKLDAYRLQDLGFDTFEANRLLSFPDDLRDYQAAAQMLAALEVPAIRLLSNNPDKVGQLRGYGVRVSGQQPTGVFVTSANRGYLSAKVRHSGHQLQLD